MTVVQFPDLKIIQRKRIGELRREMVDMGLFPCASSVSTSLILFILDQWQKIYNTGYDSGHLAAMQKIVGAKCSLPLTKIQELVKVNLAGQLIDYARENQIIPRELKASWTVHYSEGMWKLESSIKKYEKNI